MEILAAIPNSNDWWPKKKLKSEEEEKSIQIKVLIYLSLNIETIWEKA